MKLSISDLIEIKLATDDDFLKVRETLTRIGIASRKDKKLYQSCHILHKQGKYYLVHFKELFALDGRPTNISEEDIARRNTIASLLVEWKLVTLASSEMLVPTASLSQVKIIPFKQKSQWELIPKYSIGGSKVRENNFSSEES